eukprot:g2019.t1
MAAKTSYQPAEIPILERRLHIEHSAEGHGRLDSESLFDSTVSLLSADMTLDGFDLKTMFEEYDPQQLIHVIGKHGVMWLGTMNIDEWLVNREFGGRSTLTVGRNDLYSKEWEKMWMDELMGGGKRYEIDPLNRVMKVEAFVVTIKNASGVRNQGLLLPLLQRWEANALPIEVWGLATVRALVSYKWNHWARKFVTAQFFIYLLWVISFLILALRYHPDDLGQSPLSLWNDNSNGRLMICAALCCQLFMFPFTFICIRRMLGSGWQWINFWDIIDIVTQIMQVICTTVYLLETRIATAHFNIMLASQTILLIAKIQFFARAFVAVESSMLDTLKAVVGGIRWYLLLLILTLYSFACAFFILYRTEYTDCEDFKNILHSIMSMYSLMLGEWEMGNYLSDNFNVAEFNESYFSQHDVDSFDAVQYKTALEGNRTSGSNACSLRDTCETREQNCHYTDLGSYRPTLQVQAIMIFFCLYMVVMSILFYHLLIAMIIDSHSRQMEVRKLWVHLSRAEIINILETALPRFLTEQYVCPYIHVLRIVPLRDANYEKIWKQISETESSYAISRQEVDNQLQDIEADIMSRIEGISDRIKARVGYPEQEYTERVFRKLGLQQRSKLARLRSKRSIRLSRRRLLVIPELKQD